MRKRRIIKAKCLEKAKKFWKESILRIRYDDDDEFERQLKKARINDKIDSIIGDEDE